jgi:hypothetical protein
MSEVTMRAIAFAAVAVLLGTLAASAQNTAANCEKFCREKNCANVTMQGKNFCMQKCVPNCIMINEKKKGK